MDKDQRPYRRYLFTVRLWREEPGSGQIAWWGQVQSANDGERRAFREWADLVAFLLSKLEQIQDDEEG